MTTSRQPLVFIPQYFGCLVFDRRTSRYLPFDREAAERLLALRRHPIDSVLAAIPDDEARAAVTRFVDCFYERGFFGFDDRLAAELLDLEVPQDHLAGLLALHLEIIRAHNLTRSHCFSGTPPRNEHPLTS